MSILPENAKNFNVDNVRVAKILVRRFTDCAPAVRYNLTQVPLPPSLPPARSSCPQGSGIHSSTVMKGLVFRREVEGVISEMKKAKVAVYSCPYDAQATETKVCKVLANDYHGNQPLSSTVRLLQLSWILAYDVSHTLVLPV